MDKNIHILFGQAVRRYREKSGVSQEAFADLAGIHRTYVSSIERGKVQVGIGIAHQLAVALKVPLSAIWRDLEREIESAPRAGSRKPKTGNDSE